MSNKTKIEFDGFDALVNRIKKLDGNIKGVVEDALKQTKRYVHVQAGEAMQKHNRTYKTVKTLVKETIVDWETNTLASVKTGFSIREGGLASIFLMYGTPRIPKDQKLYNAFYGKKTKEEIKKIQEDIFYEEVRRLNG